MNRFYTVLISSLRNVTVILFWLLSSIMVQAQEQPHSIEALKKKSEALMLQMEKEAMDQMAKEVSKLQQKKTSAKAASNTITLAAATQSEQDALVAFYNSTGGPSWTNNTNWLSALPINQWYGVQVDGDDHVIALSLVNNNLSGPIPPQIKDLPWLRYLYLQNNELNGPLPPELGMLSDLRSMFFHYNNFSGTIPSEFGNLQLLTELWLFDDSSPGDKLTGPIPSSIGNLLALQSFAVGNNLLTGPLPSSMGNLSNLKFLGIDSNPINDSIPDAWMQMSNLETIQAYAADLTGDIPVGLTNLIKLKNISLMDNHLKGPVPSQLNNLTSLEDFTVLLNRFTFSNILDAKRNFIGNYFGYSPQDSVDTRKNVTATVGSSLTLSAAVDRNTSPSCLYQWFKYVNGTNDIPVTPTASAQYHTQVIPNITSADQNTKYYYKITNPDATDLTLVSRLQKIVLGGTGGCNSTLAQEYEAIMTFYEATGGAAWTNNTGWRDANPNVLQSITGWFGVTTDANGHLISLILEGNNLTGYIPQEIGDFCKLQTLQLFTNHLTDSIPSSIGNLSELTSLTLINNKLSGPIPNEIGNLAKLQFLYLHNNVLTGSIPAEIGNLTELTFSGLSNNRLTDSIPGSLGNLTKLTALLLFNNRLTGKIPKSFGNLVNLLNLSLYVNQLSGAVPKELGNCIKLQSFELSYNQFTDSIPKSLGNLINLRSLTLSNNHLTGTIPAELGNLNLLYGLDLSTNKLTGSIPQSLGNLLNLQQLYLQSNLLTGNIPSQLSNLTHLVEFRVDFNFLSGPIPSFQVTNPELYFYEYINNNKFTFSDFLDAKLNFIGRGFIYAPQDSIDLKKNIVGAFGTSLVLTTSIDRNTTPPSKYQWFKYVNGYSDIQVTPLSTTSHTYILQNPSESDNGARYYYKIYNDSASSLVLTSRLQTLRISPCTIAMNPRFSAKKYLCAMNFVPTGTSNNKCTATNYFWDFGDGATSTIKSPVHSYGAAGTYSVSLRFTFQCGGCQKDTTITRSVSFNPAEDVLMDSLIQVPTTLKKQVISASVATFSDSWPLQHHANLTSKNSFLSGSEGVWRNEAAFVYDVPRQVSDSSVAKISSDGTFEMEKFNWEYADLEAVPNWIKANTMTEYSPFSYELENRDVLGIYSAALYDYGGHLPSANGVNMRNAEMAFTSFEFLDGNVTGNWLFGNKPAPAQYVYKVQSGKNYMAIVEVSMDKLDGVAQVDIATQGRSNVFTSKLNKLNKDVKIVCLQEHPLNPKWTIVVFERSMGTLAWSGKLIVKNPITPVVTPDIDNTISHSGESSLRIATEKTFRQDILKLESGKKYWISGWVSVNNASVAIPKLADGLGIEVILKNKTNQVITTSLFEPSGKIIEGWQQIKGSFQSTTADAIVEIKFKPGSTGTAWYDDVRLHPEKGNMKSYVYNLKDYRLQAILDEENFASFFYYDKEGNLYLTKKETEEGIKTLTENVSYQIESGN